MKRKNWSQARLAACARLNQSQVSKIINGWVYSVSVDALVCICLALQLSLPESKDLLARAERAFSPAQPLHGAYQELIRIYEKKAPCAKREEESNFLLDADVYLRQKHLPPLPNADGLQ